MCHVLSPLPGSACQLAGHFFPGTGFKISFVSKRSRSRRLHIAGYTLATQLADVAHPLPVTTARDLHPRQIRVIANRPFAYAENDSSDSRRQDRVVGQRVEALKRLMEIVGHCWHLPEIGFGAE